MFIGHIPAGYIASDFLLSRLRQLSVPRTKALYAGVCGAIAPDIDMLYFYFVDHGQRHHHTYFTHFPLLWASLILISVAWPGIGRQKTAGAFALIFSINGFIHMLLDSIVGDIWWFAPFIDRPFSIFTVPALYEPRWLNFIFHWSFAFELMLCCFAFRLWRQRIRRRFAAGVNPIA